MIRLTEAKNANDDYSMGSWDLHRKWSTRDLIRGHFLSLADLVDVSWEASGPWSHWLHQHLRSWKVYYSHRQGWQIGCFETKVRTLTSHCASFRVDYKFDLGRLDHGFDCEDLNPLPACVLCLHEWLQSLHVSHCYGLKLQSGKKVPNEIDYEY